MAKIVSDGSGLGWGGSTGAVQVLAFEAVRKPEGLFLDDQTGPVIPGAKTCLGCCDSQAVLIYCKQAWKHKPNQTQFYYLNTIENNEALKC